MTRYSDMATTVDSKSTTFRTFLARKRLAANKKREEDNCGTVRGANGNINRNQKESKIIQEEAFRHAVNINMKSLQIKKDFQEAADDKEGVKRTSPTRL